MDLGAVCLEMIAGALSGWGECLVRVLGLEAMAGFDEAGVLGWDGCWCFVEIGLGASVKSGALVAGVGGASWAELAGL